MNDNQFTFRNEKAQICQIAISLQDVDRLKSKKTKFQRAIFAF